MLLPLAVTSCSTGGEKAKIIEKADVKVENGMLTPEVLEAFGRVSKQYPRPMARKLLSR